MVLLLLTSLVKNRCFASCNAVSHIGVINRAPYGFAYIFYKQLLQKFGDRQDGCS